ncbi:hypothetical protein GMPD_08700 [Geomonas paludis]|uniref:Uncharacterized protein n=1 Tax=Geomonas paludis TaxID=2740185 RepID=A0A6V8MSJ5_9BACT|nr:hypothetical protein GMPD_08700 [Geomonas paludis]
MLVRRKVEVVIQFVLWRKVQFHLGVRIVFGTNAVVVAIQLCQLQLPCRPHSVATGTYRYAPTVASTALLRCRIMPYLAAHYKPCREGTGSARCLSP